MKNTIIFFTVMFLLPTNNGIAQDYSGTWKGTITTHYKTPQYGTISKPCSWYLYKEGDFKYIGMIVAIDRYGVEEHFIELKVNENNSSFSWGILNDDYHNYHRIEDREIVPQFGVAQKFKFKKDEAKGDCINNPESSFFEHTLKLNLTKFCDTIPERILNNLKNIRNPKGTFYVSKTEVINSIDNKDKFGNLTKELGTFYGKLIVYVKNDLYTRMEGKISYKLLNTRNAEMTSIGEYNSITAIEPQSETPASLTCNFKYNMFLEDSLQFEVKLFDQINNKITKSIWSYKMPTPLSVVSFQPVDYSSKRIKAVSSFFMGQPSDNSQKELDSLINSGDLKASVWKGVFSYMGWNNMLVNEDKGRLLTIPGISFVYDEAIKGDPESIYLLHYILDMNLVGNVNFDMTPSTLLDKAISQEFEIATYDKGYRYLNWLVKNSEEIQNYKATLSCTYQELNNEILDLERAYKKGYTKCGFLIKEIYENMPEKFKYEFSNSTAKEYINSKKQFWDSVLTKDNVWDYTLDRKLADLQSTNESTKQAAISWFKDLSSHGNTDATVTLFNYYYYSKYTDDKIIAEKYLDQLCEMQDREAIFNKGLISLSDKGDFSSNSNIILAAQKGHPLAMTSFANQYNHLDILNDTEFNETLFWLNMLRLNHNFAYDRSGRISRVDRKFWSDWVKFSEPRRLQVTRYYSDGSSTSGVESEDLLESGMRGFFTSIASWGITRWAQIQANKQPISEGKLMYSSHEFDRYSISISGSLPIKTAIQVKKGQKIFIYANGEVFFKAEDGPTKYCGGKGVYEISNDGNLSFWVAKAGIGIRTSFILDVIN